MSQRQHDRLPDDLLIGTSTASYQIEGAWNEDGKGESIWDVCMHRAGGQNADTACDHYHHWREDVALMRNLGYQAYRFSIAWPRILPKGSGAIEQRGLDFYSRLTDSLLEAGITPFATLFHWDMPQALWNRHQGWMHRDTCKHFADYAAVLYDHLGDRITNWITHNEPRVHISGYVGGGTPGLNGGFGAGLVAEHNILFSHALAVQAFRQSGRRGQIGITLSTGNALPLTDSRLDIAAAQVAVQYDVHWNMDAMLRGSYPELAHQPEVAALMPGGYEADIAFIHSQGSDFLGINHYRSNWAEHWPESPSGFRMVYDDRVPATEVTGIGQPVVPEGMYQILTMVAARYPGVPLYVTENGYADNIPLGQPSPLNDTARISFLERYIAQALRAVAEGVPLKGYFVWSLLDNFEWGHYEPRYGLVAVDSNTFKRTPKQSAEWLGRVARERRL